MRARLPRVLPYFSPSAFQSFSSGPQLREDSRSSFSTAARSSRSAADASSDCARVVVTATSTGLVGSSPEGGGFEWPCDATSATPITPRATTTPITAPRAFDGARSTLGRVANWAVVRLVAIARSDERFLIDDVRELGWGCGMRAVRALARSRFASPSSVRCPLRYSRSAVWNSSADWKRPPGSFSSALRTMSWSVESMSGSITEGGAGRSFRILA